MATAYCGLAQDTLSGVVNRVDAPHFEQNVCDSRFAINTENGLYYVMVDGYWPNPYLEDLVIHYDTIPVGNEIEVEGTVLEMEDEDGERFDVIDIKQLIDAIYSFGTGYMDWANHYASIYCNVPPCNTCYIAINGEVQTEYPFMFNGMTIGGGIYTVIGISETRPEFDLPILELTQVIPYTAETTVIGVIMANDELCLTMPLGEKKHLAWSDNDGTHYITNKDCLLVDGFYSAIWGNDVYSTIKGFYYKTHYDLYGTPFNTFEIIQLETEAERSVSGHICTATDPPIGPYPAISQRLVIIQDGFRYYIDNQQNWNANNCFIETYTVPMFSDVTAFFSTSSLFLGGSTPTPFFNIHIDEIKTNDTSIEGDNDHLTNDIVCFTTTDREFKIDSERIIEHIEIYNYIGQLIMNKSFHSKQISFDLKGFSGLAIINTILENGQNVSKKVTIR